MQPNPQIQINSSSKVSPRNTNIDLGWRLQLLLFDLAVKFLSFYCCIQGKEIIHERWFPCGELGRTPSTEVSCIFWIKIQNDKFQSSQDTCHSLLTLRFIKVFSWHEQKAKLDSSVTAKTILHVFLCSSFKVEQTPFRKGGCHCSPMNRTWFGGWKGVMVTPTSLFWIQDPWWGSMWTHAA